MERSEQIKSIIKGYSALANLPDADSYLEVAVKHIKSLFEEEGGSKEQRRQKFIETVRPFVLSGELSKQDANDFSNYWLEISNKGRLFRFEKEKAWDINRRLSTWMKNKQKFSVVNMLKRK